ncbi:MAG: TraR/DksA C4-type zinc finger protein [Bryobacteraceae bacterium]
MAGLKKREGLAKPEPESCDEIQRATDRALVVQALDGNSSLLREVRAALARIHDGSYGQCLQCEDHISSKRVTAIPWASQCIKCQEEADREYAAIPRSSL